MYETTHPIADRGVSVVHNVVAPAGMSVEHQRAFDRADCTVRWVRWVGVVHDHRVFGRAGRTDDQQPCKTLGCQQDSANQDYARNVDCGKSTARASGELSCTQNS